MELLRSGNSVRFLTLGLLLLVLFYGFSKYLKNGGMKQFDFDTTVRIQEKIDTSSRLRLATVVGNVFEGSTFFASPEVSVAAVVLIAMLAGIDFGRRKIRYTAIIIPVLFAAMVLVEVYGKNVVHHPAPPFFMIKNPTTVFPKYYINDDFSYPSGHAARAVFLGAVTYAVLIVYYSLKKRKFIHLATIAGIIVYILLVSVSRIYLGHHWLSDIVGGWLLGGGIALLTMVFISHIIDKQ